MKKIIERKRENIHAGRACDRRRVSRAGDNYSKRGRKRRKRRRKTRVGRRRRRQMRRVRVGRGVRRV